MICVTTFSDLGYKTYGKLCLTSFLKYWPCKIIVYFETIEPDLKDERIEYRRLFNIPGLPQFLEYVKSVPAAQGKFQEGYSYCHDVWKFCRKSFAQWDVLQSYKGKVFWIDADIETTKKVSELFLIKLFKGKGLCFLGREGFFTETGFIGFDTEADKFQEFLSAYINVYKKGKLFSLKYWHDCSAFDYAVKSSEIGYRNLSSFYEQKENPTDRDINVFPRSSLGKVMVHRKGKRKNKVK